MIDGTTLREEAQEALARVWFIDSIEETERTDVTLSLRLHIRSGLFVNVFWGQRSGSLFFALIEGGRRIFGIDFEDAQWHIHPFGAPEQHEHSDVGLEPKPLLRFLSRVETLLIEHNLL